MRKPTGYWKAQKINEAFDHQKDQLGRAPKLKEFRKHYAGAADSIIRGRYAPSIRTWREYLVHRGEKPFNSSWSPEKIDEAFDIMKAQLGRVPYLEEFSGEHRGAAASIVLGRYSSEIKTWNDYVKNRGEQITIKRDWNRKDVDKAFDKLRSELKRNPKIREFRGKLEGAFSFIRSRRYSPDIETYKEYLKSRELLHESVGILEKVLESGEVK